ncbi:hypothetical protein K469DRAFT_569132 [Zopfia rhizophila CBS 207.26]|uniref:MARVEL domain-containing protein n=1 Tax=Zopfia rhizophila CBS 207.26 TaxID=1314779 RepID=A0A6A6EBM8_9PEZI|nr:hypothetical protein K469DRAFT_569132 [Zopfia rhizophila CBS 207.26]
MKPVAAGYSPLGAQRYPHDLAEPPSQLQQEITTSKKRIRAVRLLSRASSVIFNSVVFTIMAFVTSVFLSTRTDKVSSRNVWPAEGKTWPTYMLLAASLITLVIEISVLCFYWFSFYRAERSWKLVLVQHVAHFSMWLVVTFLYRYEKRLKDVWGWSCSDIAKTLQKDLNGSVNFEKLCDLQEVSWIFSIIETVAKVLFSIVYFIMYRRTKTVESKLKLADGLGDGVSQLLQAAF